MRKSYSTQTFFRSSASATGKFAETSHLRRKNSDSTGTESSGTSPEPPKNEIEDGRKVSIVDPRTSGNLIVRHPLEQRWTLWYYRHDRSAKWEDNQKKVVTVSTVEDFWSVYNHIVPASELKDKCDYSWFKEGVEPMWEDKANKEGGRWILASEGKLRNAALDGFWRDLLLALIGEGFQDLSEYVNGAVCSIRAKGDKIALWIGGKIGPKTHRETRNEVIMNTGKTMKARLLGLKSNKRISFESHIDSKFKNSSTSKILLEL